MGSSPSTQKQNQATMKIEQKTIKCNIFYNRANLLHRSSKAHPECPERLETLIKQMEQLKKSNANIIVTQVKQGEGKITKEQVQKLLVQVHGENYAEFVKEMWHDGIKKSEMYINLDTYFMKHTYNAALEAARTTLIAAQQLASNNGHNAFSMVRPPGHHSGLKSQPHGFSFFNNIALAVYQTIATKKAKKIAIVDWDVHHGQGTQKIFYHRKDVLFISLHRYDNGKFFPHIPESSSKNIGVGEGMGYNVNVCWNLVEKPKGVKYQRKETCGDQQYAYAFSKLVMPILKEYDPDFIFVSCGFDSACGDPIGNLAITSAGYSLMLSKLLSLNKKILLVLQGGYNLQVLSWASTSIVETLSQTANKETRQRIENLKSSEPNEIGKKGVEQCINEISKYWTNL